MVSKIMWIFVSIVALVITRDLIRSLKEWLSPPSDPLPGRFWTPLEKTRYFEQYGPIFDDIMRRAGIDPEKVKVNVVLSTDEEAPVEVNAAAWQTTRDGNAVYVEESAFKLAESGCMDLLEGVFAHELSHIKRNDSLYRVLLKGWGKTTIALWAFLIPWSVCVLVIAADKVLRYLSLKTQNNAFWVIGIWVVLVPSLVVILLGLLVAVTAVFVRGLAAVCIYHTSEILADAYAVQICGRDAIEKLLLKLQARERDAFREKLKELEKNQPSPSFWTRVKWISRSVYDWQEIHHPSASFRLRQLGLSTEDINHWYTLKHYLRLLFWLVSGKGFYGESVFYLVDLAGEKDSPACGTPE
ncbi:MAG: M48 family metalloprotease [Thermoanaerobacteraceae bacterium]|nr:M48 family metalloprotease [Thermoanaerobacteraceae bacterium]